MYQLRVTQLEKFRRFKTEASDYDTEPSVIDSLDGTFIGNDKTNVGSAFHWIIENHHEKEFHSTLLEKFGVRFSDDQIKTALTHVSELGTFTPEIRMSKVFNTKFGEISITGQTDVLQGKIIRDTKVTFRNRSTSEYYNSYQWRVYLSIFELDRFIYDLFEVEKYKDEYQRDVTRCLITPYEPYECIRYELMEVDVINLLNEFLEWIDYRNLWHVLGKIELPNYSRNN
jgi:hypothetical protein